MFSVRKTESPNKYHELVSASTLPGQFLRAGVDGGIGGKGELGYGTGHAADEAAGPDAREHVGNVAQVEATLVQVAENLFSVGAGEKRCDDGLTFHARRYSSSCRRRACRLP